MNQIISHVIVKFLGPFGTFSLYIVHHRKRHLFHFGSCVGTVGPFFYNFTDSCSRVGLVWSFRDMLVMLRDLSNKEGSV